ncbi:hypothetical protein CC78DRAFT_608336 [Lojkania enalia]|uniref:Uncharacterized protein n=1 Tax=Lojkania enalia TaxID=147567 RepID=A0A9P4MXJ0_9PLEO|nr:hypothetical protein CC78DRAFT_608336 [Didymosphaeria enalia]
MAFAPSFIRLFLTSMSYYSPFNRAPFRSYLISDILLCLAAGKSGVVYGIDDQRVLKEYHDFDGREIEHCADQRLGSHPNFAKVLDVQKDASIILELGELLQSACREPYAKTISLQRKLKWLQDAAECY